MKELINKRAEFRKQQDILDAKYSGKTLTKQEEDPFADEVSKRLTL